MAGVIVVKDLRKKYPDGLEAVKGVSFSVEKGEIFGLLGPNGAGKTTTMRILGTLQPATSGSAHVLGLDVASQARQLKQRIGFAMQDVGIDDLATAEEMLVLHGRLYGESKKDAKARAAALLRTFELTEHAKRRVSRFSGGMKRRLDLAVSIIHEPEVLFLDEPSTGLDPKSRSALWAILRKLRDEQGMTVLLSTHYMEEADELCDRIAIMHQGKIAAIDTPENLKSSVGADRVRVALGSPATTGQRSKLAGVFRSGNVQFQDGHLDVRVKDGARALMPALQHIHDAGLLVTETKVLRPTLDDVFLNYTGASFEAAEEAQKAAAAPAAGRGKRGAPKGPVEVEFSEVAP